MAWGICRDMPYIMSQSLFLTGHILWAYEEVLSLEDPHVEEMRVEGGWAPFVYKATSYSVREIILGWCHNPVSSIPQPIALSKQVTQPAFSLS